VAAGSSSMCQVAIPLLLGALCCVCLHLVRGLFMLVVFPGCTVCNLFGVVTNSTPFLIASFSI
jgi:hypothetical protein